eukprot:2792863-Ditylum_brightwellii.AAC.1
MDGSALHVADETFEMDPWQSGHGIGMCDASLDADLNGLSVNTSRKAFPWFDSKRYTTAVISSTLAIESRSSLVTL